MEDLMEADTRTIETEIAAAEKALRERQYGLRMQLCLKFISDAAVCAKSAIEAARNPDEALAAKGLYDWLRMGQRYGWSP